MANAYRTRRYCRIFSSDSGSITIFLSLLVLVLTLATAMAVSHLKQRSREEKRCTDIELAMTSLLAGYDRDFYSEYGLTILAWPYQDGLEREFERLLIMNKYEGLEDTFIGFGESLDDADVLKELIEEHMQDRIYSIAANDLLEKFSVFDSFSKIKGLIQLKSDIETVIFDCEKACAYLASDFELLFDFDINELEGDTTAYLAFMAGELQRFSDAVDDMLRALERLERKKDMITDQTFFAETSKKIELFSDNMAQIHELRKKIDTDLAILYLCLDLMEEGEEIDEILAGYSEIKFDASVFLPAFDIDQQLKKLDLRDSAYGFFDTVFLEVDRQDILLDANTDALLPFRGSEKNILSALDSFRRFFSEFSFKDVAGYFKEQMMVNGYIMDKFYCETDNVYERYFRNEIEYILFGEDSQNSNLKKAKAGILLLRAALNYMSIHMDSNKTALARSVGTAVSAFTFGIGGGVIAELIISSWALYEAYRDMEHLIAGEDVAVLKSKGDFSLDLGGKDGSKSFIKAGYEDYLWLLLSLVSQDTKLGRIKNLMFLNTGSLPSLMHVSIKGGIKDVFFLEKGY